MTAPNAAQPEPEASVREDIFTRVFLSHAGAVSDKWEQYLAIYSAELARFVEHDRPVRLLEIGVQNGGSLEVWRRFLPEGSSITGIDIDPACAGLALGDGITILIGNAGDPIALEQLLGEAQFDVIVDDGSHRSSDIIAAFESCFSRIAPGGIYVIEDLHCSYFSSHEGGFRKPGSAIEFLKSLVDALNTDHFEADSQDKVSLNELARLRNLGRQLARVTFYDSVAVVQRSLAIRDAPYRRIITGSSASIREFATTIPRLPVTQLRRLLLSSASAQAFEPALRAEVVAAREINDALQAANAALQFSLQSATDQLAAAALREQTTLRELESARAGAQAARQQEVAALARASRAEAMTQTIVTSEFWRATRPLRTLVASLPPWARQSAQHFARAGWHLVRATLPRRTIVGEAQINPLVADPSADEFDYTVWYPRHVLDAGALRLQRRRAAALAKQPKFSVIVPVYRTPLDVFEAMVRSVVGQTYSNWELCLAVVDTGADARALISAAEAARNRDPRIQVMVLDENLGISGNSNRALEIATGDWVALLDHDDVLAADALFEIARAVNANPDADLIHSDKDHIDRNGGQHFNPLFKSPRWSPDTMLNANYLTHLTTMPTSRLRQIGGWDPETDGAQDWDIFLRIVGHRDAKVVHVPRVLYHWRQIETSVSMGGFEAKPYAARAQLRALEKHLPVAGWPDALPKFEDHNIRIEWGTAFKPDVSVIVVGGRAARHHQAAQSGYSVEILEAKARPLAGAVDAAIQRARGDVIVLLDSAFRPEADDWLSEMVGPLANSYVGLVGGQVTDQHGHIVDFGVFFEKGLAWPAFRNEKPWYFGPAGGCGWYRNASAAAGGALSFRKSDWTKVGGFTWNAEGSRADLRFCLEFARQDLGRLMLNPFARFKSDAGAVSSFEAEGGNPQPLRNLSLAIMGESDPFLNPNLIASHRPGAPRLRSPQPAILPPHDYAAEARYVATRYDVTEADIAASVAACEAEPPGPLQRMLWVVPEFEVPFYGGIYTILRAADHLRRVHGVANAFAIMTQDSGAVMSARIARAFPDLADASEVAAIGDTGIPPELGRFDGAACSLWTTAYPLLRRRNIRRKFYFLQDWEPLFYPAGTISSAVETTYRFGFHAICNTSTLAESYRTFGGTADFFVPAVDDSVFNTRGRQSRRAEDPFVLVCYARPGTPRNSFESLLEALRLIKDRHGDKVEIVTAGSWWDVGQFGLDGVVRNLGLLPYAETGDLYRIADAGLVAMATKHPSYLPFELMACGAAVVTNRNPHTAWLFKDGDNCLLCELSRSDIVRVVDRLINEPALRDAIAVRALSGIEAGHRDWTAPLETIHRSIARICNE